MDLRWDEARQASGRRLCGPSLAQCLLSEKSMTDRSQFIREHAVCWEMFPLRELKGGRLCQVGLELRLHAQSPRADPSSTEARETYAMLREIVLEALPQPAGLEIEPYDAAVRLRHETGWAAEVDLRAEIRNQGEAFEPADAERKQAKAVTTSLRKLGISEGVYRAAA